MQLFRNKLWETKPPVVRQKKNFQEQLLTNIREKHNTIPPTQAILEWNAGATTFRAQHGSDQWTTEQQITAFLPKHLD